MLRCGEEQPCRSNDPARGRSLEEAHSAADSLAGPLRLPPPLLPPPQVVKMPIGTYEFGANLVTNRGNLMLGRITSDGRLTGRVK